MALMAASSGYKRSAREVVVHTLEFEPRLHIKPIDKLFFDEVADSIPDSCFPLDFTPTPFFKEIYINQKLGIAPFASRDIKFGEVLGEVVANAELSDEDVSELYSRSFPLFRFRELTLITDHVGLRSLSIMKHSSLPNVGLELQKIEQAGKLHYRLMVKALISIKTGELLTRDCCLKKRDLLELGLSSIAPLSYSYDAKAKILKEPDVGTSSTMVYFLDEISRKDLSAKSLEDLSRFDLGQISYSEDKKALFLAYAQTCQTLENLKESSPFFYDRYHLLDLMSFLERSPHKIPAFLTLAEIPSMGSGLFATKSIATDTLIGCYTGKLLTIAESEELEDNSYFFNLSENLVVDAKEMGNYTRFINHSKEGNLKPVYMSYRKEGQLEACITFFTTQKISKGEQLLFDYGKDYDWSFLEGHAPIKVLPQTFLFDLEAKAVINSASVKVKRTPKPKVLD
jgi:hypothetical protein